MSRRFPLVTLSLASLAALIGACADDTSVDDIVHLPITPGNLPSAAEAPPADPSALVIACPANVCTSKVQVIGCDERSLIPAGTDSTTTSPWRHVGRLSMGCTGTLIGDKYVLTAAHCVQNVGAAPIAFRLAQTDQAVCPMGTRYVKRVYRPAGWVPTDSSADRAYDYAVLELYSGFTGAVPMPFDYVTWADTSMCSIAPVLPLATPTQAAASTRRPRPRQSRDRTRLAVCRVATWSVQMLSRPRDPSTSGAGRARRPGAALGPSRTPARGLCCARHDRRRPNRPGLPLLRTARTGPPASPRAAGRAPR